MESVERVFKALRVHGLQMRLSDFTPSERDRQRQTIQGLLKTNDADTLVRAIRYGMPNVWPFLDGRAFDADDLRRNLLKAKAEASRASQAGEHLWRIDGRGS